MDKILTYKPFGAKAILIEWPSVINNAILKDILLFKEKINHANSNRFLDLIIGYNSLTIVYKSCIVSFSDEVNFLKNLYTSTLKNTKSDFYTWTIPVCYDEKFAIDLSNISAKLNIDTNDIIKLHANTLYRIHFIGFLPGFLYLGGLDQKICFDRKPNPRLKVPKGSVAIGGKQTGIYPVNSAGGWNIIGKTPINFFDVEKENPCFAKAGDFIKFKSISLDEFYQLEKEIKVNTYQLIKTLQNA